MSLSLRPLFATAALAITTAPLFAGTVVEREIEITQATPASDWRLDLGFNTWLTAIKGNVGFGRFTTHVDYSMSNTLDRLDLAFMGTVEVGYKRWSVSVDGIYGEFAGGGQFHYGPLHGDVHLKIVQSMITGRLQYRIVDTETWTIDAFTGVRWTYLSSELDTHTQLTFKHPLLRQFNREWRRHVDFSRDWFDPIIGARSVIHLPSDWFLQFSGDVGGFGVGSNFTWQAFGALGYNFTPHVGILGGYRAIGVDYDKDNFKLDTITHGPLISLILRF